MHRALTRPLATVAVVLCLQLMATVMTLRRDPLTRFEGSAIAALLWTAFGSGGAGRRASWRMSATGGPAAPDIPAASRDSAAG